MANPINLGGGGGTGGGTVSAADVRKALKAVGKTDAQIDTLFGQYPDPLTAMAAGLGASPSQLGTLAQQNANNVNIGGGVLDGVVIGKGSVIAGQGDLAKQSSSNVDLSGGQIRNVKIIARGGSF